MREIRPVKIKDLILDGKKIYVQSMLNVIAADVEGNVRQAVELEKAGCEIIRVAVPTLSDVRLISAIKEKINIPLVADIIHYAIKGMEVPYIYDRVAKGLSNDDSKRIVCDIHNKVLK